MDKLWVSCGMRCDRHRLWVVGVRALDQSASALAVSCSEEL
jgi:hypothetical protein